MRLLIGKRQSFMVYYRKPGGFSKQKCCRCEAAPGAGAPTHFCGLCVSSWYTIENLMGFLNKNAVARRQLPVLAHQRIFAVSAYLHGIMDTAQNGRMSDYTGCVPAFAGANASFWGETNQFFIIRKDCESGCVRPVGSAATHKEDCGGSGEERHSRVLENRIRPADKCWARRLA